MLDQVSTPTSGNRSALRPSKLRYGLFAWPAAYSDAALDRTYWVLAVWLVFVFMLGGGARPDVESLMILRPLSVLTLAYGLAGITQAQIRAYRFLFGLMAAWLVLHLLQLVPLPPEVWKALPGRAILSEVDRDARLGAIWRPLSMVPYGTRNATWSLLAPMAVLVLGVRLTAAGRVGLLPLLIALGLLSAVLGGLQLLADPGGAIYFYRITNNGSVVGLFANRNHQAIFLGSLPAMLLVWAALRSSGAALPAWQSWGLAGALVLSTIPLILITGSRAGLVAGLFCLLAMPAVLWDRLGSGVFRGRALAVLLLAVAILGGLTVLLGRGLAVERLVGATGSDDMRFRVFGTLLEMIRFYWPFGSGFGSFIEIYEIHEPHALLGPTYLNHAHNDWLELLLTGGLPAAAIVLVAILGYLARLCRLILGSTRQQDASDALLQRLGMLILAMLALASLGDYPLRTPSLACFAAVAALWAFPARSGTVAVQD